MAGSTLYPRAAMPARYRFAGLLWAMVMCAALIHPGPALADISRDFNTGVYLYKKGDYDLASKTFESILSKYPDHDKTDEVLFWYGESQYHLEKYADALGIYKKLVAEFPNSKFTAKARFSAGYAALKLGLNRDAVVFLNDVAADPSTDRETMIECRIVVAEALLKLGDDKQAEKALRDLLAISKLSADKKQELEYELGRLLLRIGRSAEARTAFTRAAENAGPHQADALLALGDAAYANGRFRESLEWYEKIFRKARGVKGEFRARAVYNGAWSYLELNQVDKARALFTEVLNDKEAMAVVRGDAALRLAHIYRDRNNLTAAGEMASAAEKIANESNQARLKDDVAHFRAESAFLLKHYDAALGFLARVSEKGYRVYRLTGQIFFESGRPLDAAVYFERAAAAAAGRPSLNLSLFDMAQSYFVAGLHDTAVSVLGRIKDPGDELNVRLKPFMAAAYREAGRFREAAKLFETLAAEAVDTLDAQEYRYYSAIASFEGKQYQQASKTMGLFMSVMTAMMGGADLPRAGVAGDSIAAAAVVLHADILVALGKHADAELAYLRAIPAVQSIGADHLYLAYTHLIDFTLPRSTDRLVEYADAFMASVRGASNDTRANLFVIDRLYEARLYAPLIRYTSDILGRFSPAAKVYGLAAYYQMMAFYKVSNLPSAVNTLDSLAKWVARNPATDIAEEANFWRARFAEARGDRMLAKSAYYSYLDFHPTGKYVREATLYLGTMSVEDGKAEEAERHLTRMLSGKTDEEVKRDAMLSEAKYNLASVRILQERYADAIDILESLSPAQSFKSDPAFAYKLGYVYVRLGRVIDAEPRFRSVIAKSSPPAMILDNALLSLFNLLYRAERYADLEADFKRHASRIKDKATAGQAKFLMGMTLFVDDRFTEASPYFKAVVSPADTDLVIEAAIRFADCEYNLKRYKQALERYVRIAEEFSATKWGREAQYSAGLCKIKLGYSESALSGFERFLQQNPEDPLARDVAREAAKLYLTLGDIDQAEKKLDFLERLKIEGPLLAETMRMRIKIWQKRGDSDKVLTLAKAYKGAYGPLTEVALSAAEAALKLGRAQDAIAALEGFAENSVDTGARAFMDFYRAEAMLKLGQDGAIELFKKLADFSDSDVRLLSRFRYGSHLMTRKDYPKAREMFVSILSDPAGKYMSFYLDAVMSAFEAAKAGGEPDQITRLYPKFQAVFPDEKIRIRIAEYNFWACLQAKDNAKSLAASNDLLSFHLEPRRRFEVLLITAQLQENLNAPDRADEIYSGVMNNPAAPADLRVHAESRKVNLAVSRAAAGRQILEDYLQQGAQGEWASKAAAALLSDAIREQRHADIIRTVDLIQSRLKSVSPAARYAAGAARLALSDTSGALADFRQVADNPSSDTFYAAWSAYFVAVDERAGKNLDGAKKYFAMAWKLRANLDKPSALNSYRQLAEILFEASDYDGMQVLAADPTPDGMPTEPHLLKGLGAWRARDYATAARHLKEVAQTSVQLHTMYAETLYRSGDTASAILEFERIADGHGEAAGMAQLAAGDLYESMGRTSDGLIGYYKVLAVHESDTQSELAADALLRISRLYAKTGDAEKSKNAALDLIKKYPDSRPAKEAGDLAGQ